MAQQLTDRNRFARRPALTLAVTAIVGCIVFVLAAEFGARILFPEWAPAVERVVFLKYDPLLGWSHRPGQEARFVQAEFTVDVKINALGMRDSEYSNERGSKQRMLVIGDSFAWGFGVEHSERFSEIIESEHADWEIMNASVNGYGTDQQLLYLKDAGLTLEPDVVLLLLHPNDFENNVRDEQYWHYKPRFVVEGDSLILENVPVPRATTGQLLRRHLIGRTYLGEATRKLWRYLDRDDQAPVESNEKLREGPITTALLERIARLCEGTGARFVVASVPMSASKVTAVANTARLTGFSYLPLDSAFAAAAAGTTFDRDKHWTPYGHDVAATAIRQFLVLSGVLEDRGVVE